MKGSFPECFHQTSLVKLLHIDLQINMVLQGPVGRFLHFWNIKVPVLDISRLQDHPHCGVVCGPHQIVRTAPTLKA